MDKETIEKILEIAQPPVTNVNERPYWTTDGNPVKDPVPDVLLFHTLTGLAGYLESSVELTDDKDLSNTFIVIDSPTRVRLCEAVSGVFEQRPNLVMVEAITPMFENSDPRGRSNLDPVWLDPETFIIRSQSMFEETEDLKAMLAIVGNIREEAVQKTKDDGVTQEITARQGVVIGTVELPNPVTLKPYRTFVEVDQPESKFILRMKTGPHVAIIEADGGAWQNEAMTRIKDWLVSNVPEAVKVFA